MRAHLRPPARQSALRGLALLLGLAIGTAGARNSCAAESHLELFPRTRLFPVRAADPAEFSFSAQYVGARKGPLIGYLFGLGTPLPLAQLQWAGREKAREPLALEVGLEAGARLLIDDGANFPLQVADFEAGLPLDCHAGPFVARLRVAHESSHLGDDYIRRHPEANTGRFNRESVAVLGAYRGGRTQLYAGGSYFFHRNPSMAAEGIQWGGEVAGPRLWRARLGTYAAADFRARGEVGYDLDVHLQAGVALRALAGRDLRLAFRYTNGHSPFGQFFRERIEWLGLGLFYFPFSAGLAPSFEASP